MAFTRSIIIIVVFFFNCYFYFILFIFAFYFIYICIVFTFILCLRVTLGRYDASMRSYLQPHSTLDVAITSLILSRVGELFGHALLYGYELPPSFPPQTLTIVFYGRDTLGKMMMMIGEINFK